HRAADPGEQLRCAAGDQQLQPALRRRVELRAAPALSRWAQLRSHERSARAADHGAAPTLADASSAPTAGVSYASRARRSAARHEGELPAQRGSYHALSGRAVAPWPEERGEVREAEPRD